VKQFNVNPLHSGCRDGGKKFKNVLDYFDDGDTFILNNTRVFPARMWGNKEKTGAKIEVFMLRELNRDSLLWDVIVDPARKIRIGNKLYFGKDDELVAEVIDNTTSRGRTLRFLFDGTYGTDVQGNGDELALIYNAGSGTDPTEITGSWDVCLCAPTNVARTLRHAQTLNTHFTLAYPID
jgi:hypothetical protein